MENFLSQSHLGSAFLDQRCQVIDDLLLRIDSVSALRKETIIKAFNLMIRLRSRPNAISSDQYVTPPGIEKLIERILSVNRYPTHSAESRT